MRGFWPTATDAGSAGELWRKRPHFPRSRHPLTQENIDPYCTLNSYDWQAFYELLIRVSAFIPCLLCGEVHLLRIHARLWRKVRSPEEGQNIEITIIAIIC